MEAPSSKRIKSVVTVKIEKDIKKPLSKINEQNHQDPEHYRTIFKGPAVYCEDKNI